MNEVVPNEFTLKMCAERKLGEKQEMTLGFKQYGLDGALGWFLLPRIGRKKQYIIS